MQEKIERLKKIKISPLSQQDLNAVDRRTKETSLGKTNQLILEEENYSQNFFENTKQFRKEKENGLLPKKSIDENTRLAKPRRHSTESTGSQVVSTLQ